MYECMHSCNVCIYVCDVRKAARKVGNACMCGMYVRVFLRVCDVMYVMYVM